MSSTAPEPRAARALGFRVVGVMVAVMWVVEVIDAIDHHGLDREGIVPRNVDRLYGILTAPFLHASFGHLIGNTVPFVVLGLTIALDGAKRLLAVTVIVILVGGLGTWLTAPGSSVTVGASGVVFGYAGYLLARGFFSRRFLQLAIGVVVAAVFGAALLWSLVPRSGVSWQGHLFGGIAGILAARLLSESRSRRSQAAPGG